MERKVWSKARGNIERLPALEVLPADNIIENGFLPNEVHQVQMPHSSLKFFSVLTLLGVSVWVHMLLRETSSFLVLTGV